MAIQFSLCILVICMVCTSLVFAQFGGPKQPDGKIVKEDLPYIACDVCANIIEEVVDLVDVERDLLLKGQKLEEIKILDILEEICNTKDEKGRWIRTKNIVSLSDDKGTYLELEEPGGYSKCGDECATIKESCNRLLKDEIDVDDLSALLYKKKQKAEKIVDKVCKSWSNRCKAGDKKKYLPKGYLRLDSPFEIMDDKDLQMETLMAQLEAQGMGGSMYGRDDLASMADMGEFDDYADEDMMGMGGMGGMDDMDMDMGMNAEL